VIALNAAFVLVKFRLDDDGCANCGVFVVLNASARNCSRTVSVIAKFLKIDESRLLKPGPYMASKKVTFSLTLQDRVIACWNWRRLPAASHQ
jgi:hypothetical protein